MKLLALVVVCCLLCAISEPQGLALDPNWKLYQFGHRAWKVEDGFLGSAVSALAQDRDGYLWIGTSDGLLRFDGTRFLLWNPPGGRLPNTYIMSLLADRDGSLWVSTQSGISHWDHSRLTEYQEEEGSFVFSMVQDKNGAIWFAPIAVKGSNGDVLCNIWRGKTSCIGEKEGLKLPVRSKAFFEDGPGSMWLGQNSLVAHWKNGTMESYPLKSLAHNGAGDGVSGFAKGADGSILVGMYKRGVGLGLQHLKDGKWKALSVPGFDGSKHEITVLFTDRRGALWIGTRDEGLYRLFDGKIEQFSHKDGLSGDHVSAIYEDEEGSIWAGTTEGLDQFRDLAVQNFPKATYPKSSEFNNLVTAPDGTMWVGGEDTLYTLRNHTNIFTPQGGDLRGKQVTAIFGDRRGRVWIGIDDTLNLYSSGSFVPVRMMDGHPTGFIVSIAEDTTGSLWALTTGPPRRLLEVNTETLVATPRSQSLDASKITADPSGGLWVGTNYGDILHFSGGTITSFPLKQGSHLRISQLNVVRDGSVLAAGEFGLAHLAHNSVQTLTDRQGLPCSNLSNFVFDQDGNLWLYMQCGLVRVDRTQFQHWLDDPNAHVDPHTFSNSDGIRSVLPPFEGAARSGDGRLWFDGMESLQMVDPNHLHLNGILPPVHIEGIRVDFQDHALADRIRLAPLTRDIEIAYTAASFAAPQKIRFRYKLMGFDPQWHDVGTRRQAVYMNLKPGEYVFQVIACNNDGVWNMQGDTLRFSIAPTFYQTRWFLACMFVLFFATAYVVFVVRLRISTSIVEGRMNERLQERDRIARELHDTLLQGFQGIVLKLQGVAGMIPGSSPARKALEETMDRADNILIDGRRSLLQLRSNPNRSLVEELRDVISDFQLQVDLPCELVVHGQERPLAPQAHEELLAMGREAIANAFRHSKARQASVELTFGSTHFSLLVRDDGVGLPREVVASGYAEGHWGLVGLKERADNLRAAFKLKDQEPTGTEIEIVVRARTAYLRRRRHSVFRSKA